MWKKSNVLHGLRAQPKRKVKLEPKLQENKLEEKKEPRKIIKANRKVVPRLAPPSQHTIHDYVINVLVFRGGQLEYCKSRSH